MNVFPASNSTLSPEHIAVFVKGKYKLSQATTARIIKTGISDTYLITGDDRYIFRVYSFNWRTETEIQEEIKLLNLLKENNIPVSYPLSDGEARYIQQLNAPEGKRFGVLFTFAKGEKMLNIPADLHYKLGQIMANLHQVTQDQQLERVTYTPDVLLVNSFDRLKLFLPAATDEMTYMAALQAWLLQAFSKVNVNRLRHGVVHLDIWFDNLVIDNNEDITLFDFDFCGNGWLVLDIAYYVLQLYSTEKDANEFNLKKENFLRGYESVTSINDEEKQLLPAAAVSLYFFYLGVQCSRYDNWSNAFLNEIYLKRFINLLIKKWADFHKLM